MLENHEVKEVKWVETSRMLADVLTKRAGNGSWIRDVISRNTISKVKFKYVVMIILSFMCI